MIKTALRTARGGSSIPGLVNKTPHAPRRGQKKKKSLISHMKSPHVPPVVPAFWTGKLRLMEVKCPAHGCGIGQATALLNSWNCPQTRHRRLQKDTTWSGPNRRILAKGNHKHRDVSKTLGLGRDGKLGILSLTSPISEMEIVTVSFLRSLWELR